MHVHYIRATNLIVVAGGQRAAKCFVLAVQNSLNVIQTLNHRSPLQHRLDHDTRYPGSLASTQIDRRSDAHAVAGYSVCGHNHELDRVSRSVETFRAFGVYPPWVPACSTTYAHVHVVLCTLDHYSHGAALYM